MTTERDAPDCCEACSRPYQAPLCFDCLMHLPLGILLAALRQTSAMDAERTPEMDAAVAYAKRRKGKP